MSTRATVLSVLKWAVRGQGEPPEGELDNWTELFEPSSDVCETLQQLTVLTAARLRLNPSRMNSRATISIGGVILAAAVGARNQPQELSPLLLELIVDRPPAGASLRHFVHKLVRRMPDRETASHLPIWSQVKTLVTTLLARWKANWSMALEARARLDQPWSRLDGDNSVEWLARHAVAEPALPHLPPSLADACRHISPLTSFFDRPVTKDWSSVAEFSQRLLSRADFHLAAQLRFADPRVSREVRDWRSYFLEILAAKDHVWREFVLDVFETGMAYYQPDMLVREKGFLRRFESKVDFSSDEWADIFSLAWRWGVFEKIESIDPDSIRARPYLVHECQIGIRLFRRATQFLADYQRSQVRTRDAQATPADAAAG